MKELPYFKFYPAEWLAGDISQFNATEQGIYLNLCIMAWRENGVFESNDKMVCKRLKIDEAIYKKALQDFHDCGIIVKNENMDNAIKYSIKFINEQLLEFNNKSEKCKQSVEKRYSKSYERIRTNTDVNERIPIREEKIREDKEKIREDNKKDSSDGFQENTSKPTISKINFNFEVREWENITDRDVEEWATAYPACDVNGELNKMHIWLIAHPEKRKKNYRAFIQRWLSKQQEMGGTR